MMAKVSPLASVAATRSVLAAHGLATKKSLGQNFLINDDVLKRILALAAVSESDNVLEVGPGIGTLTVALLDHARSVIAVERDRDLPAVLAETTAPWSSSFALISKDALALTSSDVACAAASLGCDLPGKVVANLPYAVAATVVLQFFQEFGFLDSATVMVQKEVADRMAANPGTKNYGAYTVKLSLYAEPAGRFAVGPGNFFPPPHVDSAVLRLNRIQREDPWGHPLTEADLRAASLMADAAFASRRKTLANSCKTFFSGRGSEGRAMAAHLPELFEACAIDPKRRGETLTTEEFIMLGLALKKMMPEKTSDAKKAMSGASPATETTSSEETSATATPAAAQETSSEDAFVAQSEDAPPAEAQDAPMPAAEQEDALAAEDQGAPTLAAEPAGGPVPQDPERTMSHGNR